MKKNIIFGFGLILGLIFVMPNAYALENTNINQILEGTTCKIQEDNSKKDITIRCQTKEESEVIVNRLKENHYQNVNVTDITKSETETLFLKDKDGNEVEFTEAEAIEKREELEKAGYQNVDIIDRYIPVTVTFNDTYTTEEEADKAIEDLKNDGYKDTDITKTPNTVKQTDEVKDEFDNEEAANNRKNELDKNGYENTKITENKESQTKIIDEETYGSDEKEVAENRKAELENDGYSVDLTEEKQNVEVQHEEKYDSEERAKNAQQNHPGSTIEARENSSKNQDGQTIKGDIRYYDKDEAERVAASRTTDSNKAVVRKETERIGDFSFNFLEKTGNPRANNSNRVNIFLRIDNAAQYENGTTHYENKYYYYLGSVVYNGRDQFSGQTIDLKLLEGTNNQIIDVIESSVSMQDLLDYLHNTYGVDTTNKVLLFYVLKNENDSAVNDREYKDVNGNPVLVDLPACGYHIDAVLRDKDPVDVYYIDETPIIKGYDYILKYNTTEEVITGYKLKAEKQEEITTSYTVTGSKTYDKVVSYTVNAKKEEQKLDHYVIQYEDEKIVNDGYMIDANMPEEKNNDKTKDNTSKETIAKKVNAQVLKTNAPKTGINDNILYMIFALILTSLLFTKTKRA